MATKQVGEEVINLSIPEQAEHDAMVAASDERRTRLTKIEEIKAEGLSRINAVLPQVDTFEELDLLRTIAAAFTLSASGLVAKDIYLYAQTKINQAKTAPIAQVIGYDPAVDPSWP